MVLSFERGNPGTCDRVLGIWRAFGMMRTLSLLTTALEQHSFCFHLCDVVVYIDNST